MDDHSITRRSAAKRAAGALALGAATGRWGSAAAAPAPMSPDLGLDDPKQRAMIRAKVVGSTAEETIYSLFRLHLYGYMNGGNLVPFFTMNNLSVTKWRPLPNGNYQATGAECGVYCRFDTDEVLDVWENPITGEKRPVWEFLGGPLTAEIGPDGATTGGVAELKPVSLRMEVLGDMLFVPTQSDRSYPNPFDPKKWPTESPGPTTYWDSHFVYAAKVEDVVNPALHAAPAFCQFQNLGSWHPWLGLGGHEGRTYGKAYGAKLKSVDDIPPAVRAGFDKKTPEIFSFDSWTAPHIDFKDYMATHKPA